MFSAEFVLIYIVNCLMDNIWRQMNDHTQVQFIYLADKHLNSLVETRLIKM